MPVRSNVTTVEEHIGEIEWSTRTVNESNTCHVHRLLYKRHPRIMIVGCVTKTIKELNQVPAENGISNMVSPCILTTGRPSPEYLQVRKLKFGDYVQTYINKGIINTNKTRTVGAIELHPSGNERGW